MDWSILAQDEDGAVIVCPRGTFVVHSSGRVHRNSIEGPVIHTISDTDEANPFDDPNVNSIVWGKVFQDIEKKLNTVYLIVEVGIEYNDNWHYIDNSQDKIREAYRSREKAEEVCRTKRLTEMRQWRPGQFADDNDLWKLTDSDKDHIKTELKKFGITWNGEPTDIDLYSIREDDDLIRAWDLFENAPQFAHVREVELEEFA